LLFGSVIKIVHKLFRPSCKELLIFTYGSSFLQGSLREFTGPIMRERNAHAELFLC